MTKELIVSSNGHETMVAILEDDLAAEIFVERERHRGVVGNVYVGRVSKILPGMQSSFLDIALERDGFLYVADVIDTLDEFDKLAGDEDDDPKEAGKSRPSTGSGRPEPVEGRFTIHASRSSSVVARTVPNRCKAFPSQSRIISPVQTHHWKLPFCLMTRCSNATSVPG